MPYASEKQRNLMRAVAHSPSFAKKVGIPQSVGQKFESHKATGGEIMASKKLFGGKESYAEELKEAKAIKSGRITPQQYARGEREEERGMKKMKKFADGGSTEPVQPFGAIPVAPGGGAEAAMGRAAQARRGMLNAAMGPRTGMPAMKKGGSVKKYAMGGGVMESKGMTTAKMGKVVAGGKRAHGEHTVQQKGHTKGKMVKMMGGGKC